MSVAPQSEPPRKRSITLPMAIIGFVAGVVTVIVIVRLYRAWAG